MEAAVGREAGESGPWNVGGTPMPDPLHSLSPEMHREARGEGPGAGPRGGPTVPEGPWRLLNPSPMPPVSSGEIEALRGKEVCPRLQDRVCLRDRQRLVEVERNKDMKRRRKRNSVGGTGR